MTDTVPTRVPHISASGQTPVAREDSTPPESTRTAARPIRVLLVDDQALMRMGFAMVLKDEAGIEVIGQASDGAEAIRAVDQLRPDVVLMDVRMPVLDGIEATRQITTRHPETKVIVATTFDLDEYAFGALRAGASGFLLKDAKPEELANAIRHVATGDAAISPRVTRRMLDLFADQFPDQAGTPASDQSDATAALDQLTSREREVFDAIVAGLTNAEIASRLVLSETTVKTHVGNILSKLGQRDRVQVVIWAYESGLCQGQ